MLTNVALVGSPTRAEIQRLAIRLEERGCIPAVLDGRSDPRIEMGPDRVLACGLDLSDLRGVYVADLGLSAAYVRTPEGRIDPEASRGALARSRRQLVAWNTLFEHLAGRGVRVVNPPTAHDLHALKPFEMSVYASMGLPVPETIATSNPEVLVALGAPGTVAVRQWISKGMVGGYGYTESFDPPRDASAARKRLAAGPRMVQERIEGDNCRAFVLGGRVVGVAEIISAAGSETDSRRGDIRVRRIVLPDDAQQDALRAAARWGMPFSAVDFMRDERAGRFVLLECNSSPFFVNFEMATGCDISGALADFLLARSRVVTTERHDGPTV